MPGKTYVHSFERVQVTLNSLPITGFWEGDDAVMIEPHDDNGEEVVGADGDMTFSYSADDAVNITLKLKPSSPANALLNSYYRRSRAGTISGGYPISIRDTGTGEGGSAAECHIKTAPSRGLGKNATERTWVLVANAWTPNEISYTAPGA